MSDPINALLAERDELRNRNDSLQELLNESVCRLDSYKGECAEQIRLNGLVSKQVADLESDLERCEKELDDLHAEFTGLETVFGPIRDERDSALLRLDQIRQYASEMSSHPVHPLLRGAGHHLHKLLSAGSDTTGVVSPKTAGEDTQSAAPPYAVMAAKMFALSQEPTTNSESISSELVVEIHTHNSGEPK